MTPLPRQVSTTEQAQSSHPRLTSFGLTSVDWKDMVEEAGVREGDDDKEEDAARRLLEEQDLHDG